MLDNENILDMSVDERSRKGLLAMQYPKEISGITNADLIKSPYKQEQMSIFLYLNL